MSVVGKCEKCGGDLVIFHALEPWEHVKDRKCEPFTREELYLLSNALKLIHFLFKERVGRGFYWLVGDGTAWHFRILKDGKVEYFESVLQKVARKPPTLVGG
ncbi:hypothetical protein DRJ19_04485 [Candidatus Woesearchaeota archaeon]|nr:MAG: hypothetical protein DRJ19_04485 [Candidatus Woesearchaeota archaeon]